MCLKWMSFGLQKGSGGAEEGEATVSAERLFAVLFPLCSTFSSFLHMPLHLPVLVSPWQQLPLGLQPLSLPFLSSSLLSATA